MWRIYLHVFNLAWPFPWPWNNYMEASPWTIVWETPLQGLSNGLIVLLILAKLSEKYYSPLLFLSCTLRREILVYLLIGCDAHIRSTVDFVFCILGDTGNCPSLENMDVDESVLFGTLPGPGAALLDRNRLSSESSCLSSMTMDSEDGYQTCVSEDSSRGGFSRQTSTDDECFVPKDGDDFLKRSSSRRNRSVSSASSGSMSPMWEGNFSNMFGTLPRKSRRGSVRKQLLKFIPGLHRAVEEEESRFWWVVLTFCIRLFRKYL